MSKAAVTFIDAQSKAKVGNAPFYNFYEIPRREDLVLIDKSNYIVKSVLHFSDAEEEYEELDARLEVSPEKD